LHHPKGQRPKPMRRPPGWEGPSPYGAPKNQVYAPGQGPTTKDKTQQLLRWEDWDLEIPKSHGRKKKEKTDATHHTLETASRISSCIQRVCTPWWGAVPTYMNSDPSSPASQGGQFWSQQVTPPNVTVPSAYYAPFSPAEPCFFGRILPLRGSCALTRVRVFQTSCTQGRGRSKIKYPVFQDRDAISQYCLSRSMPRFGHHIPAAASIVPLLRLTKRMLRQSSHDTTMNSIPAERQSLYNQLYQDLYAATCTPQAGGSGIPVLDFGIGPQGVMN